MVLFFTNVNFGARFSANGATHSKKILLILFSINKQLTNHYYLRKMKWLLWRSNFAQKFEINNVLFERDF